MYNSEEFFLVNYHTEIMVVLWSIYSTIRTYLLVGGGGRSGIMCGEFRAGMRRGIRSFGKGLTQFMYPLDLQSSLVVSRLCSLEDYPLMRSRPLVVELPSTSTFESTAPST